MNISAEIRAKTAAAELALTDIYADIDRIARVNTEKVLDCFREAEVSESLFTPSTGYGYGDRGRDVIDALSAKIFGGAAGFMRPQIISGTHAITVVLFGLLRPGDILLSLSGMPYDTLLPVIGCDGAKGTGSLADFGVEFHAIPLKNGKMDLCAMRTFMEQHGSRVKVVHIQRSKGYETRPTHTVQEICEAAYAVRKAAAEFGCSAPFVTCDNCYGEFTEEREPALAWKDGEEGVDIIVGSLIKNPGGGMADNGGYIVGTEKAVELCGYRLSCPGVGLDAGASLGQNRNMLRGLFYAPHTVAQAMKTAHLTAYLFGEAGYTVSPVWNERRSDIIQTVECASPEGLCAFCRGIQSSSPIDAHVVPEPWDMPGYSDPVIMAAGAFVGGASIELSADGPLRAPYTAFLQGGLTYESARLAIMSALQQMTEK